MNKKSFFTRISPKRTWCITTNWVLKQARSQDLEKGGGYFETVRSVQTTLTRILIDLESVSDGLSEIWDEMSRKFKGFFRPKLGDLQKKKKKKKKKRSSPKFRVIFRPKSKIQTFFLPKIRCSPKKKKKKKSNKSDRVKLPKFRVIFRPKSKVQTFFLPKIRCSPKKKKKKVFAKI